MSYLTYQEYNDFGFTEIDEAEFNKLIKRAGDALNSVTRSFYVFNDIDEDHEFRAAQFKKAVACQLEYFHNTGATTSHELNEPTTIRIGRTDMSRGSRNSGGNEQKNSIVSDDVYMYLNGTGLLYKGVATC